MQNDGNVLKKNGSKSEMRLNTFDVYRIIKFISAIVCLIKYELYGKFVIHDAWDKKMKRYDEKLLIKAHEEPVP